MTQAPTPGPLSVTIGQIDLDRLRSIIHLATHQVLPFADKPMQPFSAKERAGMQVEIADLIINDIGKANAPTAPVEASGSEREALAVRFHETYERLAPSFGYETRDDTKAFDPTTPNGRLMIAVCGELLDALRPQPSGETRARIEEMAAWMERGDEGAEGSVLLSASVAAEHAADLRALLSAHPLALGGQNSAATLQAIAKDAAERVHKNGGCVPQLAFAPILFALQDALSAAPARAEAQDEGAAAEPVATHKGFIWKNLHGQECIGWFLPREFMHGSVIELYAHPSPTPAADADRVRETVAQVIRQSGIDRGWAGPKDADTLADRILAALKSEGK